MKAFCKIIVWSIAFVFITGAAVALGGLLATKAFGATPLVDAQMTGANNQLKSGATFTYKTGSTVVFESGVTIPGAIADNANLDALGGVTSAADKLFYFTGSGTGDLVDFTSYSRTLLPLSSRAAWANALLPVSPSTNQTIYWDGSAWSKLSLSTGFTITSGVLDFTASAPSNATYIVSTSNGTLTNEFALGSLSSGLLMNTTGTGIPTIAVPGTDYIVPTLAVSSGLTMATAKVIGRASSGTGVLGELSASNVLDLISSTRGAVLYRGSGGWAALSPGTNGYVLTSSGTGADPVYSAPSSGSLGGTTGSTDTALLRASGTGGSTLQSSNVTLATSGTEFVFSGAAGLTAGSGNNNVTLTPTGTGYVYSNSPEHHFGAGSGNVYARYYASSGSQAAMTFADGGTEKWFFGKQTDNSFIVYDSAASRYALKITTSTDAVQFGAYGAGTLTTDSSGNITASSDERIKDIQGNYTRGLAELRGVQPINFKYKATTGLDTVETYSGFSAQNILANIPEAVDMGLDGKYTVQDRTIVATLVNAVNQLSAQNALLAKLVQDLANSPADKARAQAVLTVITATDPADKVARAAAKDAALQARVAAKLAAQSSTNGKP